jgi:hypothetical protein
MNYFDSDENYDYHEEEDDNNEEQLFNPSSPALSAAERNL